MNQSNKEEIYCIGCGAKLQSADKEKSGYVPSSVLKRNLSESEEVYCKRCFRLRHYNEVADIELTDDDFLTMLNEISSKDALIVNLVDVFDLNGTMISGMQRFAGDNPLLVIGNKIDLLPTVISQGKIRQWLTEQVHSIGLRPKEVGLVSALRSSSVKELMELIDKERHGRDVYIVGTTNVGKSTLINQIINIATESDNLITTSYFPGTTLGMIHIPLDDGSDLIDTPGIIQKNNLTHLLNGKELKKVIPQKEIKPKVYQLDEKQTIFIEGLARFDYVEGSGKQSFVFYISNDLTLHRTKLENADSFYEKQLGELLNPPTNQTEKDFPELKEHKFIIDKPEDIVIAGLGWLTVEG
ncbi:MAG: ribosome biogenesis GTPase YqeH, partial [Staphylococcus equorum]|nr:ribosome biogenesis GTPase YqeH [Staphylococcus equorum]